jgi:hypothetical protein
MVRQHRRFITAELLVSKIVLGLSRVVALPLLGILGTDRRINWAVRTKPMWWAGITKYASLYPDETSALAAL